MNKSFAPIVLLFEMVAVLLLAGCGGTSVGKQKGVVYESTNEVFSVRFVEFDQNSRPVIEVTPNGKPRPKGAAPFGDYYLVLRPDDSTPYVRQVEIKPDTKSVKKDFAISKESLSKFSKVTVTVENPTQGKLDRCVLLSNVVEIPLN